MGWGSTAAGNIDLNAWYGAGATLAAATLKIALYDGDPRNGGVEVTSPTTLPRATVNNNATTWPSAASGGSKTSAQVTLGPSVAAMTGIGRWWAIHDGTSDAMIDCGLCATPVDFVVTAGYSVRLTMTVSTPLD